MKHEPVKLAQTTTPGTPCPILSEKCVGSSTSPVNQYREGAGDGPMVYCPYPTRLECLTICGCHCTGSTFSSVILRL